MAVCMPDTLHPQFFRDRPCEAAMQESCTWAALLLHIPFQGKSYAFIHVWS